MLTNFKICVECSHNDGSISLEISDRNAVLHTVNNICQTQTEIDFQVTFPNRLTIKIDTGVHGDRWVKVYKVKIGTLEVPKHIYCQIFNFCSLNGATLITDFWHNSGVVTVDLFAKNWVQYHLLYGNKISSRH